MQRGRLRARARLGEDGARELEGEARRAPGSRTSAAPARRARTHARVHGRRGVPGARARHRGTRSSFMRARARPRVPGGRDATHARFGGRTSAIGRRLREPTGHAAAEREGGGDDVRGLEPRHPRGGATEAPREEARVRNKACCSCGLSSWMVSSVAGLLSHRIASPSERAREEDEDSPSRRCGSPRASILAGRRARCMAL